MAPKARSAKKAIDHLEGRCQGTASKKRATKTKATRTRAPAPTASALPHLRPRPRRIAQEHTPRRR
jgi:hypothetical protein